MVNVTSSARRFASPDDIPVLRHVWSFETDELASIGYRSLAQLTSPDMTVTAKHIAAISQALLEFADLQDMTIPQGGGRFYNINFFYFEGMSALREAFLTGLNGCLHASFAVLRAAFEMLLLDSWWRMKRHDEQTYGTFYGWFDGSSTAPGAGRLLPDSYKNRPEKAPTEAEARDIYGRLCSYVHKPSFREAVTTIRRSARTKDIDEALRPWLGVVESTLRILLDLQVRASPRCLFPVEVTRKFGFNPPVGMFFDASNSIPLEAALGSDVLAEYRAYYGRDGVPSEVQWASEHPDLTDEQILATWSDADPLPNGKSVTETIALGEMLIKAKIRGMSHVFAYDADPPVMPDFNKMLHDTGLDG